MDNAQTLEKRYHLQVYNRYPVTLERGLGAKVWDTKGVEYIDALGGIAVNNLGHSHPKIVAAIKEQAGKLLHVSNFYYTEAQSALVQKLAQLSDLDRVFFGNSGMEAMEAAIKLARKWGHQNGKSGNIISLKNGFHGRSIATITMSAEGYQKGFDPLPTGFEQSPYNDIEALAKIADSGTVAIVFETIQGNSGVHIVNQRFFQEVRNLCDDLNILLIIDEIQTGVGRTGKFWSFEHFGIQPDIITSAKALAGGIPIGAMMVKEEIASVFGFGDHGTTFGGNPFACAVANASIKAIEDEGLLALSTENGAYMMEQLKQKTKDIASVVDIRGLGLMIGVELDKPAREVVEKMFEHKVLSNAAGGNVIRLVPPLVITKEEIDFVIDALVKSL